MLREGEEMAEVVLYKPTALEARYRYPLLEDKADSGLNFDLVDVLSWESPWVRLESRMPPAKKKKYSDTDSATQASSSSYYQHYQKKSKTEISANAIMAAKYGRVAAADLVLPFEQQIRSIPKSQQLPLYQRDLISSSTSAASVSTNTVVPWLKRTEYMTAKEERSVAKSAAFVSESLDDFLALESRQSHTSESPSSNTTSHMDVDTHDTRDDDDKLLDDVLGSSSQARTPPRPASTSKGSTHTLPSPFQTDATKVLRSIERSFDAIASRTSIIHPSEILQKKKDNSTDIRRSTGTPASDGPYIVEEWDLFPNELVWPNSYLSVQSDIKLPPGELLFLTSHTHDPSLLKPSVTEAQLKLAHDSHQVPQKHKELLTLFTKPGPDQAVLPTDELAFQSHWEAEATSLRPSFDTMGSYVFVIGPTTSYDADEDEESGVVFEGDTHNETLAARSRKNKSLAKAKVGTATFKNLEGHVQIKPPTAEGRNLVAQSQTPETIKLVPSNIPDLEMHMRNAAADSLRE